MESLYASKLKLHRAKEHLFDINRKMAEFRERNPYIAIVEHNPDTREFGIKLVEQQSVRPYLADFSLRIGDCIHNLRTSLDLMAVDLVKANKGSPKGVYFPFCKGANELDAAIRDRNIDRASPTVVAIFKALKPYAGGNDALRAIHDLDVRDKHQMMLPVDSTTWLTKTGWYIIEQDGTRVSPLKDGLQFFTAETSKNMKVGDKFHCTVAIAFPDGYIFERLPIEVALHRFVEMVEGIVKAFEPYGI